MSPDPIIADLGRLSMAYHVSEPSDDVRRDDADPLLLIHGFASNSRVNWISTSWVKTLNDAGYTTIAIDNRGHGDSQKFYFADDYGPDIFADDAVALLDHLGIDRCGVIGYSMGARITAWLCHAHPASVSCAVFGGMGARMIAQGSNHEVMAHALETDDPDSITDKGGITFRRFAERTGSDRFALAACIRPSRQRITADTVASITTPILVAVGTDDEVGGSANELAALMPNAEAYDMPGLDHMKATGADVFKARTLEFLETNLGRRS